MRRTSVLVLAALGCICAPSPADDATDALSCCTTLCGEVPVKQVHVTLKRQEGAWRVTGVRLWAERLTCSDLRRLAALTTLDTLEIAGDCQVAAEAIGDLAALPRLRRVSLCAHLGDAHLRALSLLRKLEDLELHMGAGDEELRDNNLVHLRNLGELRRLSLGSLGFGLADRSIECIKPLTRLEELDLRFSDRITDAGVAQLRGLHNLHLLRLERLGAAGVRALEELPRLEHLSIGTYDPADGKCDFSALGRLKCLRIDGLVRNTAANIRLPETLRRLELGEWWFDEPGRLNFQPVPRHLESLWVSFPTPWRRGDKPVDLKWLISFPELTELTLDGAFDGDLMGMPHLTCLRSLAITGQCGTISDQGMKVVGRLRQLESLRIQTGWRVTDGGMQALRNLAKLRRLELLVVAGASEKGLGVIWELKNLGALDLDLTDRALKGSIEGVLARAKTLSELEELSLRGTLTDKGLRNLADLKKLRSLDLTWCDGYTDKGLASLMAALPYLQVVKRSYERE